MKIKRFTSAIVVATISLLSSSLFVGITPQKAHAAKYFCWWWEPECVVDGEIDSESKYFKVDIRNNTSQTIWVAAMYLRGPEPLKGDESEVQTCRVTGCDGSGRSQWVTDGYWELSPGETAFILGGAHNRISNRYIFFHAHDAQGNVWGNSEHIWEVNGEPREFFKADMGGEIVKYTQWFE